MGTVSCGKLGPWSWDGKGLMKESVRSRYGQLGSAEEFHQSVMLIYPQTAVTGRKRTLVQGELKRFKQL